MTPTRLLTSTFTNVLAPYAKLKKLFSIRFVSANSPKRIARAACGIARAVAVLVSLSMGIVLSTPADGVNIESIHPKAYIRMIYPPKQALCLIRLYGKESAFNPRAIGNEDGIKKAYGIPQLKNPIIKDLSANKQIDYGIKYIDHRYQGKPCKAWEHSKRKGWY